MLHTVNMETYIENPVSERKVGKTAKADITDQVQVALRKSSFHME